jgi:hypothetical protein
MDEILNYALVLMASTIFLLLVVFILRKAIWFIRHPFYLLNYIQWVLYNPIRFLFKNPHSEFGRRLFIFLNLFLIAPIYWLAIHLLTTPIRAINSLYFDVLLYWSVMLDDSLSEVFMPKLGKYRFEKGFKYNLHWTLALPYRLFRFVLKSFFTIVDSILMFGVSIVFPTLTMYHGTKFNEALTKIVQNGKWLVGGGDHAGSGIYFAIQRRVARHYSPSGQDKGILILRVTMTLTRNQVTLKKGVRELVGQDGRKLSQKLNFPFYTIEHWRTDMDGWWEYCLVQPNKAGQYVRTWRIRPVAVLKDENHRITRVWGGFQHYCLSISNCFVGVLCWCVIFMVIVMLNN